MRLGAALVLCAVHLVLPQWAYSVSRVGNNRIADDVRGFEAKIPENFVYQRSTREGGVVLLPLQQSTPPLIKTLAVRPASVDYPDLAALSRDEVEAFFENARDALWTSVQPEGSNETCSLRYVTRTARGSAGVAYWGNGKGVAVMGPPSDIIDDGIFAIMENLRIQEGACRWEP